MDKNAIVAMSGGVDSSVAAYMMIRMGFNCTGIMMKLFDYKDNCAVEKSCCSIDDADDARNIAFKLGMNFYVLNFKDDFEKKVIGRFVKAYEAGATPNPCIDCNRFMKFEKLFNHAKQMEINYIATGHYARIEYREEDGRYLLKKSVDESKDQSYVLYALTQEQLKRTVFPLGGLCKTEVRRIAEEQGFVNAHKGDSQDICFVPDGNYAGFIENYTGKKFPSGKFLDIDGNILGEHRGLIRYTIGQRKGLGLALCKPVYVRSKNVENNTVTVCENSGLFSRSFEVVDLNWISHDVKNILNKELRLKAKVRYKHREEWALIKINSENTAYVEFEEPQRAIAEGQATVFYDGDEVVGGGTINNIL